MGLGFRIDAQQQKILQSAIQIEPCGDHPRSKFYLDLNGPSFGQAPEGVSLHASEFTEALPGNSVEIQGASAAAPRALEFKG